LFHAEAIIDKKNLIHNFNYIKKYVGDNVNVMPVVKANAYGHGVVEICKILSKCKIKGFCVALLDEVIHMRNNKIENEILHLGAIEYKFDPILLDKKIILTINNINDILFLDKIGKEHNHQFNVHIKIDTGMTRLGILDKEIELIGNSLSKSQFITVEGVYSQLSSADEDIQLCTDIQRERFIKISDYFCSKFSTIKFLHLTPSAGLLKNKKNHFNMVRPGLSIYGINNVSESHPLKSVMRLKAPVALIKNVKKGSDIGYNRTYKAKKDMSVAILQVGYADAVPLEFSNVGFVEYQGKKLNILGKVSMDLICVCIDGVNIKKGDMVTIYGGELTKLEIILKNKINTPYSILTRITSRVKRVYN